MKNNNNNKGNEKMKVLKVCQIGPLSDIVSLKWLTSPAQVVWADNGKKVIFPIPLSLSETRARKYIPATYCQSRTFSELCEMFPDSVEMTDIKSEPAWGSGWYGENANGFAECLKSNWDSSD